MEKDVVIINEEKYQKTKKEMGKKSDIFTLEELQKAGFLSPCLDIF